MKSLEWRTFLVLLLLSALIFLADRNGFLDFPKSGLQFVINPISYTLISTKRLGEETFSFLTFWRSGEARIKNLEQRNLELLTFEQRTKALEVENEVLRKQMEVTQLKPRRLFPATVLSFGAQLLIAGGSNDGLKVGQSVVVYDNFIGRISRVTPRSSVVLLPFDSSSKLPVKIGQTRGLVVGQFNSSMSLERVAVNETIANDDVVLTSGEGDVEPNLIVGKVGKIEKQETDLFLKATVVSAIDYSQLTTVFVILN